ncbi:hypothetical protein [Mesorhizobium sp. M6A.T.Cr.TU.017.01.1.1]|nr:hypothetical protein [Mesorhizobium sp. M6A.T.Cr.TU.017.01.1.1]
MAFVDEKERGFFDKTPLRQWLGLQERRENLDHFAVVQRISFSIVAVGV